MGSVISQKFPPGKQRNSHCIHSSRKSWTFYTKGRGMTKTWALEGSSGYEAKTTWGSDEGCPSVPAGNGRGELRWGGRPHTI